MFHPPMPSAISRIERRRARRRGAAYVEFLLAFMPILLLFLGLVQLGLLYSGNLVVQHAAHRAVRAAVVVLDDDPRYYATEPRMSLGTNHASASDLQQLLVQRDSGDGSARAVSRRATIELAAMMVIASIEPREGDSIADALGSMYVSRQAQAVRRNTDVDLSIDRSEGDETPPIVRVNVSYGFACRVPVVREWICRGHRRIIEAQDWGAIHEGELFYSEGDWGAP